MKRILFLVAISLLVFSCGKSKNCYDCKMVVSNKKVVMQNTLVSQKGSWIEEFCGSEQEMMDFESLGENSYETQEPDEDGNIEVKNTTCNLK